MLEELGEHRTTNYTSKNRKKWSLGEAGKRALESDIFPHCSPGQDHRGQKEEVESPEYKALLGLLLPALPLTLNFLSSVNTTLIYN